MKAKPEFPETLQDAIKYFADDQRAHEFMNRFLAAEFSSGVKTPACSEFSDERRSRVRRRQRRLHEQRVLPTPVAAGVARSDPDGARHGDRHGDRRRRAATGRVLRCAIAQHRGISAELSELKIADLAARRRAGAAGD